MLSYIWPVAMIVICNTTYHVCSKSAPSDVDPLASLTVTYLVGAAMSFALYFILNGSPNLLREYGKLNWAPFVLGAVIVGLEAGNVYAYRAGWSISTLTIVQSSITTLALIAIGLLFYRESLTWNKVVGIVITMIGLIFINIR